MLSLTANAGQPIAASRFRDGSAKLSPDGRWMRRRPFYRSGNKMMVVAVNTIGTFHASAPRMLWTGDYSSGAGSSCGMPGVASSNYDVTPDGQHFLMVRDADAADAGKSIVVVLNCTEELKKRDNLRSETR